MTADANTQIALLRTYNVAIETDHPWSYTMYHTMAETMEEAVKKCLAADGGQGRVASVRETSEKIVP